MNDLTIDVEVLNKHACARAISCAGGTLSFKTGHLNLLMGPNGSGKTTLLDALALRRKAGREAIARRGHKSPMDIAYLPQKVQDVDDISLGGFLRLCQRGSLRPTVVRYLDEYIGLSRRELRNLSGGERRFLFFLAVAGQQRKVHIYDEPFQFLDDHHRQIVTNLLAELVGEGRLVIAVVHEGEISRQVSFPEKLFSMNNN